MKKRVMALFLSLMLIVGLTVPVYAADATLTTSITAQELGEGSTAILTVHLNSNYYVVKSIGIKVEYDSDDLVIENAESLIENTSVNWYDTENHNLVAMLSSEDKYDSDVLRLTISIKTALTKTTRITLIPSLKDGKATIGCTPSSIVLTLTGHNQSETVIENYCAASCLDDGRYDEVTYCSICHEELSREHKTILATGHEWDDGIVTKAATCTEEGVKSYTCKHDEHHTYAEAISATGHTPSGSVRENEKIPTCEVDGSYDEVVYCSVCHAEISRNKRTVPTTGNHIDADGKWESDGTQHWHTCYYGTHFDVDNHTGGTATCTEKAKCSICGAEYGEYGAHGETEVRNAKEVTCCEDGYTGDTYCKECNAKIASGSVIPATGNHIDADDNWESNGTQHWHTCYYGTHFDVASHTGGTATCAEKAKCSICGAEYGEYGAHHLTHHDRVEPDYENEGNIEYWTCDECGRYFDDSEGNNEISADDVIIAKLIVSKYQFIDGEVIIEAPTGAIPEGSLFDVQKIVPPPAEVVEKVKEQMGSSSEVLAYYEIRLSDTDGELIIHLDGEITIKIQMPDKYAGSKCVKVLQEDETGKLITMESWWEGEYLCYKTDWLEIYN